jgi:DNA-binding LytR/AlgR family response regulator
MIKYLIIDDEFMAHDIIKGYCDILPNMELMKHCYDAIEAIEYLNSNSVDLIFLDLNMPKLKGFDFLKTLTNAPKVIVTTAYKEFALEGYELDISDYLLKPFSFERFLKAVNKATKTTETKQVATPSTNTNTSNTSERIFFHSNKKHFQVEVSDILFIESDGNYSKVVLTAETISIREKVSDILMMLSNSDFVQVHKSFAVAKQHIKSIEGNRIYIKEHIIPIGKMYKLQVTKFLSS